MAKICSKEKSFGRTNERHEVLCTRKVQVLNKTFTTSPESHNFVDENFVVNSQRLPLFPQLLNWRSVFSILSSISNLSFQVFLRRSADCHRSTNFGNNRAARDIRLLQRRTEPV